MLSWSIIIVGGKKKETIEGQQTRESCWKGEKKKKATTGTNRWEKGEKRSITHPEVGNRAVLRNAHNKTLVKWLIIRLSRFDPHRDTQRLPLSYPVRPLLSLAPQTRNRHWWTISQPADPFQRRQYYSSSRQTRETPFGQRARRESIRRSERIVEQGQCVGERESFAGSGYALSLSLANIPTTYSN